jgi:hypothetical protein
VFCFVLFFLQSNPFEKSLHMMKQLYPLSCASHRADSIIAQTSDANAAGQSSLDGSPHEFRREERERDRHIDLSNAALVACSNLLDILTVPATISSSQSHPRSHRPQRLSTAHENGLKNLVLRSSAVLGDRSFPYLF